jgi:hypothetical protein
VESSSRRSSAIETAGEGDTGRRDGGYEIATRDHVTAPFPCSLPSAIDWLQYARLGNSRSNRLASKTELVFEKLLFASRWILAPIFLGLRWR